jgi:hypothetical protein
MKHNHGEYLMRLFELFDKIAKWSWSKQSPFKGYAAVAEEIGIEVTFTQSRLVEHEWEIEFTKNTMSDDGWTTKTLEPTGTGNEFVVFSTVLDIIRAFMQITSPSKMTFSAGDIGSRTKLYSRLVGKFAYANGLHTNVKSSNGATKFILTRDS